MKASTKLDIAARTPPGWYGLATPPGWDTIVEQLFLKLVAVYPDLEVYQIKEKFGGLRFYTNKDAEGPARALTNAAEAEAWRTCQRCGAAGAEQIVAWEESVGPGSGWVSTLCKECASDE